MTAIYGCGAESCMTLSAVTDMEKDIAFDQSTALVVGGGDEISGEVCLALAEAGANVALSYCGDGRGAEGIENAIRSYGGKAHIGSIDVTEPKSVSAFVNDAAARFGLVHSVIYITGALMHVNSIGGLTVEEWGRMSAMEVNGAFHLVKATLPHLRAGGGGAYLSVFREMEMSAPMLNAGAEAPKAAIESLFCAVAKEEGPFGIRANCMDLGGINANFGRDGMNREPAELDIERIKQRVPFRRLGSAQDVAAAALCLLSSKASFITGQSLAVDGGMQLCQRP